METADNAKGRTCAPGAPEGFSVTLLCSCGGAGRLLSALPDFNDREVHLIYGKGTPGGCLVKAAHPPQVETNISGVKS